MDKDSGSAEELINDDQRCAVPEDTSATEDVGQVNGAKAEAKRCADLPYCSHGVILCHIRYCQTSVDLLTNVNWGLLH